MARSRWSFKVRRYDGVEEDKEPKKARKKKNPSDSIWTKYETLEFATRGKVLLVVLTAIALFLAFLNSKSFDDWVMYFNVQPHSLTVDNPLDLNEQMRLTVNLYSNTFGAQSSMDAYVTLQTNSTYRQNQPGAPLPSSYFVLFPSSYCGRIPPENKYDDLPICKVDLNATGDGKTFRGNGLVKYSTEGKYDVMVGYSEKAGATVRTTGLDFINVDSLQITNNYYTFKAIATTGTIGAVLAFLNFYHKYLEGKHLFFSVESIDRYRDAQRENKHVDDQE